MPEEATFAPTKLVRILGLLHAYLVEQLRMPATSIFITALEMDDVQPLSGQRDLLIQLTGESPLPWQEGGGRHVNGRSRGLKLALRTRLHLDQPSIDTARLTEETFGHLAAEEAIVDALESFQPTDAAGNVLALPILCGEWSAPTRGALGQHKKASGRIMTHLEIALRYLKDLNTTWE